ncbi:unnamed protein product [marine sediment metagenome]|uniref:Uncharacterized protein n=1 Tax=marine sediment metagenome TaxID=412755 RepID=X0X6G2_9ZZZZ
MGLAHFELLKAQAYGADCDAVAIAAIMRRTQERGRLSFIWADKPFSVLVRLSRGLVELREQFDESMQALLVSRKVTAIMTNPETGLPVRVTDPAFIVFDNPTMQPDGLAGILTEVATNPEIRKQWQQTQ